MSRRKATIIAAAALLTIAALVGLGYALVNHASPGVNLPTASVSTSVPFASSSASRWPQPDLDLSPSHFHERVDGADEHLRSLGCQRLLFWRVANPPVDLEVLVFDSAQGASKALAGDAAADRTAGLPGDEGWSNGQALYFRRGAVYARLIADNAGQPQALLSLAQRMNGAIETGEIRP